jgi:type VI protein secretion system component VasK
MRRWIPFVLCVAAACHGQDKLEAAQKAEVEKQAEIDARAKQIAERVVSDVEEQEIRRVAEAILVPHRVLMEIRARYRDRLEVLQNLPRGR